VRADQLYAASVDALRGLGFEDLADCWASREIGRPRTGDVVASDVWANACLVMLELVLGACANQLDDGLGHEHVRVPSLVPGRGTTVEFADRCGACEFAFVRRLLVPLLAARAWLPIVAAEAFAGRVRALVDEAQEGDRAERPRAIVRDVEQALARAGIDVLPDTFRNLQFEGGGIDVDYDEIGRLLDEEGNVVEDEDEHYRSKVIGGEEPCPRCEAIEWVDAVFTITTPELDVELHA
jgi:hypothetical protein